MENVNVVKNNNFCCDCNKKIEIDQKEIKNGVLLNYNDNNKIISVFKCKNCFKKDSSLKNFRKCEVYSRIVGYIRPVKQWHIGKKQEFKERKEFVLNR
ncbi:MAG: anaerobic ribonucleoside-triphosphate reductase [Candidatus Nealsonbacteria bacterium]